MESLSCSKTQRLDIIFRVENLHILENCFCKMLSIYADWGPQIDVVGFCFLDLASNYVPPESLVRWLEAGDEPIYIGFGSLVSFIFHFQREEMSVPMKEQLIKITKIPLNSFLNLLCPLAFLCGLGK